jgi:hypothetical protein
MTAMPPSIRSVSELVFLRRKLDEAIDDENPEMVSEALDCLKATGFANDPQVQEGTKYLIASQRPDGSWAGDPEDPYTEYQLCLGRDRWPEGLSFSRPGKETASPVSLVNLSSSTGFAKKANLTTDEHGFTNLKSS